MEKIDEVNYLIYVCRVLNLTPCGENSTCSAKVLMFVAVEKYLAVISIDHMRQKKKYCKTLASWASELQIFGFLLFYQRWIFLLLQGSKKCVKEFITRHKTVCIDVDSSGKPCKEKMSKILHEGSSSGSFSEYFVKEVNSVDEMEIHFINSNTIDIFKNIIKPLIIKNKSNR